MSNPTKTKKHWIVLAVICLMYAGTLGLGANTMGVYYTPVSEDLTILRGDFAMNHTISALVTGIFSLGIPKILEKVKWKSMITVGVLLTFVSILGMGLTTQVWIFNVLGIFRGIGIAMTAMVSGAALINQWFDEKNGLAISLATSFSGIAGIVFSPVLSWLIEAIGWQNTFIIHGLISLLLSLPAILYPYTFDPKEDNRLPYGGKHTTKDENSELKEVKEEVRSKDYLGIASISLILMAALQTAVVGVNQHLPSYGELQGLPPQTAGWMLSAVMLGNMFFKLFTGYLSDQLGAVRSMYLMITLNILAIIAFMIWTNPFSLILNAFLYGAIFGTAVLYVILPNEFFGPKVGNAVYSIMIFSGSMALAMTNVLIGYIYDFTGSYTFVLGLAILVQCLSLVLLYVGQRNARAKNTSE